MKIVNYSEFRSKLKEYLDSVENDSEVVFIKRGESNGSVLISVDEYNSIMESLHLISSEKNRERLMGSISQVTLREMDK